MREKHNIVGLDIGTATIKAVSLKAGSDGLFVDKVKIVESRSDPQDQVRLIRQVLSEFKARRIAVSIPGRSALVRSVSIPARAGAKIESTLKIEVQHRIPFPLEQVFWDSCRLPGSSDTRDFLVCAIKKDIVRKHFAPYYDFPEEVTCLDVDPLVLLNLMHRLPGFDPLKTYAVLDVGRESSNLVIFRKNLVLVRSLTINGESYSENLREEKGLSPEDAEQEKMFLSPESLPEGVAQATEGLVAEIQSSFDYWRLTQKGEPVGAFYLSGGGALIAGLGAAIEAKFQLPVKTLDPFAAVRPGPGMDVPLNTRSRLAVALGLALRGLSPREVACPLNFLPVDYVKLQRNRRNRIYVYLSCFIAVVLAFTPGIFLYLESTVRETLVGHLKADLQEYEQYLPRVQDREREISDLKGKYQTLHDTLGQRYLWLSRLIAIGRLLPGPEIVFTRFTPTPDGGSIVLEGQVQGPSTSLNFRDFRQLIVNLNNHPFFSDVAVDSLERRETVLEFALTIQVRR